MTVLDWVGWVELAAGAFALCWVLRIPAEDSDDRAYAQADADWHGGWTL